MENRGSLTAWPGAFYLCGQGPSICVARGLLSEGGSKLSQRWRSLEGLVRYEDGDMGTKI